ncbi:transporter substrate-binding domain-containing protein [Afifella pfennigii]|uniref:transporter substrate-binding domain-containing protein n=1 Tax=Afifella pfennigii TaxID=209897 RepID=UPI0009FCA4ED|nr:transporter substrate-binding domain-containing protein [Afifella pfennigii]
MGALPGFFLALILTVALVFAWGAGAQAQPVGETTTPDAPAAASAGSEAADTEARAPNAAREVNVGLYLSAPFVMAEDGGGYSGMAVELWEAMAMELELEPQYRVYPTIKDLVTATATGEVDVAVTNLSITEARARRIDFTYPWFDSGLRIMVDDMEGASFGEVARALRDFGYVRSYLWIGFVILMASVLFTLFYRRFDKDFPKRWREGFAEGFFAVMSIATSGKAPIRKNYFGWLGRIWAAIWLLCGVAVVAYVTSTITSVMTTITLNNQIDGLADLPGKRVAVAEGSVAEDFARANSLEYVTFPGVGEAAEALLNHEVDAIVGGAPVLEYYAHTHPGQPLEVIGAIFEPDKYGFGVTLRTGFTRPLTVELIALEGRDELEGLRRKYFGNNP